MQAVMTKRQEHASNLTMISDLSRDRYYRRMSYAEAAEWLLAYDYYISEGYHAEMASHYAWDSYFAPRTKIQKHGYKAVTL